jgi:cytochrome c551/c552
MVSSGNEHQPPSRAPIRLLGSVLLLGAVLAWWGTRDDRHLFGEPPRKPTLAAAAPVPQNMQDDTAMLARGPQVEQRQCAGCHDLVARSSGPSYQEIATFYLHRLRRSASRPDLMSALAAAAAHPQPGWANFAPGPDQSTLALEDRLAVASWILDRFGPKKRASEGAGR